MRINFLKIYVFLCVFMCFQSYAYSAQDRQQSQQLQSILNPFKNIVTVHFYYHEIRGSKFFLQPQQSSGKIIFNRDDYLLKQTTSPEKIKFIVKNNNFQLYSYLKDGSETAGPLIPLNKHPELSQFYNLTANLLKGNAEFIEHYYVYVVQVQDAYWLLTLKPKTEDGFLDGKRQSIKSIIIKGHLFSINSDEIISIETHGFNGEYSYLYVDEIISKTLRSQSAGFKFSPSAKQDTNE